MVQNEKHYHITQRALKQFRQAATKERIQPVTLLNLLLYEATLSEIEVLEQQVEQFTQASHGH